MAFARYNGKAEKALLTAGLPRVYLFRPRTSMPCSPERHPGAIVASVAGRISAFAQAVLGATSVGTGIFLRDGYCTSFAGDNCGGAATNMWI
jgi:hypothetical protein